MSYLNANTDLAFDVLISKVMDTYGENLLFNSIPIVGVIQQDHDILIQYGIENTAGMLTAKKEDIEGYTNNDVLTRVDSGNIYLLGRILRESNKHIRCVLHKL